MVVIAPEIQLKAFLNGRGSERFIAGSKPLGRNKNVWFNRVFFYGPLGARATKTGDHLIDYEQDAVLLAESADGRHEVERGRVIAGLVLNRFDDHASYFAR